ncbi:hypothetical protein Dsin_029093 [Dipteronia sinensis]|uniref:Uncharacterized protein n=1 Tax=Dipteronia sinensis TaxID=43782 RepID=A0AAD9ZT39_9ROSI|nr:hypothetical protein Dsin_029093 [Dipteronia sinensis]
MTAILERRESERLWGRFCNWITSTENRLYIGWFGVLMIPTLLTATSVFIIAFIAAPPVDIDGIRNIEPYLCPTNLPIKIQCNDLSKESIVDISNKFSALDKNGFNAPSKESVIDCSVDDPPTTASPDDSLWLSRIKNINGVPIIGFPALWTSSGEWEPGPQLGYTETDGFRILIPSPFSPSRSLESLPWDSSKLVVAASVQCIFACLSPQAEKASAILMGMRVAVDENLNPAVLESDAKWVVEAINNI